MNETSSPLPPPSGASCPNCGAAQSAGATYCTNCGAPLKVAPASLSRTSKIIFSIALGFGALMFGAVGACFVWLGGGAESFTSAFALFVIVPALAALACLWGIFFIQRK